LNLSRQRRFGLFQQLNERAQNREWGIELVGNERQEPRFGAIGVKDAS